uniref:Uncharacterized protein n=1 Tax=Arundo donax TaxID=35708 RepID=A0A0A9EQC3_ARUDO
MQTLCVIFSPNVWSFFIEENRVPVFTILHKYVG